MLSRPFSCAPAGLLTVAALALSALTVTPARAESSCSSDGQKAPLELVERFMSADCATCWTRSDGPAIGPDTLTIDWIVPGQRGDEAPLAAAARRDGAERLQARRLAAPPEALTLASRVASSAHPPALRVAQGLPFNGYMAASIEMKPRTTPPPAPWTAWLALVEVLPIGTERSPVARHLVRNSLRVEWDGRTPAADLAQRFFESRPMAIPEGTQPLRLRAVGWVEDAGGTVRAMAQARCSQDDRNLVESGTGPKNLAPGFFVPATR